MKKLDEIPKKNIFEVPEGYFDRLPMKIQARVETGRETFSIPLWHIAVRYALPIIVVGFSLFYFFKPESNNVEDLLTSISNEHLMAFLDESDISENDLLEMANFNDSDADSLSQHLNDNLLGDFDVNEFKSVLENEL